MVVLIRADASARLGGGHVSRQLALALALREGGAEVGFACRDEDGLAARLVEAQGFRLHRLPAGDRIAQQEDARLTALAAGTAVDWVVVDQYQLGIDWERASRGFARRILVVDDLADRPHDADVLVDQNHYAGLERRYDGLAPESCARLLGPAYALLRPEFEAARRALRRRDGAVRRILVSFGMTDPAGQTRLALEALRRAALPGVAIDVAIGRDAPGLEHVCSACASLPAARCHVDAGNMAEMMAQADFAFGSGGVSTNERMCLGLPSAVAATSSLQENSARDVAALGAHRYLGPAHELGWEAYAQAIADLVSEPSALRAMSEEGMRRTDGVGARWVAAQMLQGTTSMEA
jgi:UDP-2,4-diacetamido-2,4,6-trideoxy-beta-L-altropyranose hydrolase